MLYQKLIGRFSCRRDHVDVVAVTFLWEGAAAREACDQLLCLNELSYMPV